MSGSSKKRDASVQAPASTPLRDAPFFSDLCLRDVAWLVLLIVVCGAILLCSRPSTECCSATPGPGLIPVPATVIPAKEQLVSYSTQRSFQSRGEEETRAALFRLFGKPFIKIRPWFIVNPETNRRLELDCHNKELRVAVEFDGKQHLQYPNPFHRTLAEFQAQQRRDAYKTHACAAHGICLVRVPHTVPRPEIEAFLKQQLILRGQGSKLIDKLKKPLAP